MLHVLLVIAHITFAAIWFGLAVALPVLSRTAATSPSEALTAVGTRVVQIMTVSIILFYILAVANFFVGGGFSAYPPPYHISLTLGLALVLIQVLVIQPTWQKLGAGDADARKRLGMWTGIGHAIWFVVLALMFFGPKWSAAWGF
jgi:hypothetical protein